MNYRKIYAALIRKAKSQKRVKSSEVYYEAHHIKPRSLFPKYAKSKYNLVLLTAREHFIAHKLLTKIYPVRSMFYAFMIMANKASPNHNRDYKISSREFAKLKNQFSINNPAKTEKARKKISKSKKGKNHHFYGVTGKNAPNFKNEIFTFTHKDGHTVSGTRTDLFANTNLTKAQISNLITGYRYTAKGWKKEGVVKPAPKKGADVANADLSLYCWYNKHSGLGYVCNKHDFEQLSNIKRKSINTLIYKTRNSVFGWVIQ